LDREADSLTAAAQVNPIVGQFAARDGLGIETVLSKMDVLDS
jgi:hypothetical protein